MKKILLLISIGFFFIIVKVYFKNQKQRGLCLQSFTEVPVEGLSLSDLNFDSVLYSKSPSFQKYYHSFFEKEIDQNETLFVCTFKNGNFLYKLGGEVGNQDSQENRVLKPFVLKEINASERPVSTEDVRVLWKSSVFQD